MPVSTKLLLAGGALVLALGSAALSSRARTERPTSAATGATEATTAPATIEPFALAKLLAEAPPDLLVVALDEPHHALRGAMPLAALAGPGATDDAFVASAPKRRVIVAAFDLVRADRLARRLLAKGTDARVLAGGLDAWDRAMDADPPAPPPGADAATWEAHRRDVALRHAFGDASLAPPAPVMQIAPVAAPAGAAAPKKREGC